MRLQLFGSPSRWEPSWFCLIKSRKIKSGECVRGWCMAVMTDGRFRCMDSWWRVTLASKHSYLRMWENNQRLLPALSSGVPLMTALQIMSHADALECVREMCFSFFFFLVSPLALFYYIYLFFCCPSGFQILARRRGRSLKNGHLSTTE